MTDSRYQEDRGTPRGAIGTNSGPTEVAVGKFAVLRCERAARSSVEHGEDERSGANSDRERTGNCAGGSAADRSGFLMGFLVPRAAQQPDPWSESCHCDASRSTPRDRADEPREGICNA